MTRPWRIPFLHQRDAFQPAPLWTPLATAFSRQEVDEVVLLLESQAYPYRLDTRDAPRWDGLRMYARDAWEIQVRPRDLPDIVTHLEEMAAEHAEADERRQTPLKGHSWPLGPLTATAMGLASLWIMVHWASGARSLQSAWFRFGTMTPAAVWGGQWHRLITATWLHADIGHLAGNLGFGMLYFMATAQLWGPGVVLLLWSLTAAAGMLASAWWNAGTAMSVVGASGGVFGLLGAAGAWSARRGLLWGAGLAGRRRTMAAVGATLGLFAWTGFSERADIAGHVGGLVAGALLGWFLPALSPERRVALQWVAGAAWLGLAVWAWWPLLTSL